MRISDPAGEAAAARRPHRVPGLRPDAAEAVDAAFVLGTSLLALVTLRHTYDSWQYLVVAGIGLLVGLACAHVGTALRLPWIVLPFALAVAYLLLGGVVALRADPDGSAVPGPGTVHELYRLATRGWWQLLTTLPPVDGGGPLLALPFLLGLAAGGLGLAVANRTRAAGSPALVVLLLLAGAILLGTAEPGSLLVVGTGLGVTLVAWVGLRAQRRVVSTRTGRTGRAVTALVVLGLAAAAVSLAGRALPGVGGAGRTVLRAHVTPPLDLSRFPSPLVGYRAYRPAVDQLADATLFRVAGLPSGVAVRIATLDGYDGQVWGVTNDAAAPAVGAALDTFQRIGTHVTPTVTGRTVHARVTVGAAYAASAGTAGWLPDAGSVTSVRFEGRDAAQRQADVRYNLATGTAVVPGRVRSGETYTFSAVVATTPLPTDAVAGGAPRLDPGTVNFVQPAVAKWTAGAARDPWHELLALATHLRTQGAFSDGGPGESQFLPGHGIGRLTTFLGGPQPVGDDEQYAAAFALMADDVGIPARVVVGAVPGADGTVRGRDVHAWVEVLLRGHGWVTVPTSTFTPPETQKPNPQQQQVQDNSTASVVPPPNAVRPPSSLDQLVQSGADSSRRSPRAAAPAGSGWHLPAFVAAALTWGGPPVAVVVGLALLVVAVKALRRRRRRTRGDPATRLVAGWQELLDVARDLGGTITRDLTRTEQAAALDSERLATLAQRADRSLFGEQRPDAAQAGDFWADVRQARRDLLLGVGRWPRLRARLSLRSLRPVPPSARPAGGWARPGGRVTAAISRPA